MRFALSLGLVLLAAAPAGAVTCISGSPDVFAFHGAYSAQKDGQAVGGVRFVNATGRIIKMAHVIVVLEDALGEAVGSISFPIDDTQLPKIPSAHFFRSPDLSRLSAIAPDNIRGVVCTRSVLFDDGEAQHFP